MRKTDSRIYTICKTLRRTYPDVKTQLTHRNPFELLIATILSAQCTDKQVNRVTEVLFKIRKTPADFAHADIRDIEALIYSTGFYHNKAKQIRNCSKILLERFAGKVPKTLDELLALPGVGRKTANVVLGAAFGIPGIVVDTHVARISQRLELSRSRDPVKIEFDLMKVIPKKTWNDICLRLIYFGRDICTARKPDCPSCPLAHLCHFPGKTQDEFKRGGKSAHPG